MLLFNAMEAYCLHYSQYILCSTEKPQSSLDQFFLVLPALCLFPAAISGCDVFENPHDVSSTICSSIFLIRLRSDG